MISLQATLDFQSGFSKATCPSTPSSIVFCEQAFRGKKKFSVMLVLGSPARVRMGTCHICLYLLVYGISAGRWERDAHCPRQISTLELLIDFTDG